MAESETLELILRAIDNATAEITELREELGELRDAQEEMNEANDAANFSFTELKSAWDTGEKVLQKLGQVYDATITKTLEYGESVRTLSRNIGATPEEASKLIQAADDVKVSTDTLTSSLNIAIRKGVDPTIEGLGRLADKYFSIQDPVARTKFLMDNFGKSGADMAPLMAMGADGIRELGDAAQATSLVLSGEALAAMREHEMAVDSLVDAWDGFVVTTSGKVIPVLTDVLDELNGVNERQQILNQLYREGIMTQEQYAAMVGRTRGMGVPIEQLTAIMDENVQANRRQIAELTKWRDETDRAVSMQETFGQVTADASDETEILKGKLSDLQTIMSGPLGNENENYYQQQRETGAELAEVTAELEKLMAVQGQSVTITHEATGTANELFLAQNKLLSTTYVLGKAQQDLAEASDPDKQHEAAVRVAELQVEYDKISKSIQDLGGYNETFTADNTARIEELKIKQGELSEAYQLNADEHEDATKRIIFNLLQQRLATDGYTQAEFELLQKVGSEWGLFDEATSNALKGINKALAEFNEGNINNTAAKLYNIFSYPPEKVYNIKVNYQGPDAAAGDAGLGSAPVNVPETPSTAPAPGPNARGARGLDFIVPPGFPNDSFTVGVQSGERVKVTPATGDTTGGTGGGLFAGATIILRDEVDILLLAKQVTELQRQGV